MHPAWIVTRTCSRTTAANNTPAAAIITHVSPTTCHLLNLPLELCDHIFELAVTSAEPLSVGRHLRRQKQPALALFEPASRSAEPLSACHDHRSAKQPALVRTCRHNRAEALPTSYGKTTFRVEVMCTCTRYCDWILSTQPHMPLLRSLRVYCCEDDRPAFLEQNGKGIGCGEHLDLDRRGLPWSECIREAVNQQKGSCSKWYILILEHFMLALVTGLTLMLLICVVLSDSTK